MIKTQEESAKHQGESGIVSDFSAKMKKGDNNSTKKVPLQPCQCFKQRKIQLLEYPIPPAAAAPDKKRHTRYLGNREWYHRSAGVKTKGNKISFKKQFLAKLWIFWISLRLFLDFSNALSNHRTVAWVTRPEHPKGRYLEVT